MHSHFAMAGHLSLLLQPVLAVRASTWSIFYPAQWGAFPLLGTPIRDVTATLLSEVCHDVAVEPHLQSLEGETFSYATAKSQDGTRLDIVASGFWGERFERSFYDVGVLIHMPLQPAPPNGIHLPSL